MYIAPVANKKTGLVKPNGHKRTRIIPKVKLIQLQTISLLGNNADLINLKKRKKDKKTLLLLSFFACHLLYRLCESIICRNNTFK